MSISEINLEFYLFLSIGTAQTDGYLFFLRFDGLNAKNYLVIMAYEEKERI